MTNEKNVVTSQDVAPVKKPAAKKIVKEEIVKETPSVDNKILIYFESGMGYVTSSGYKFTRDNPMAEVSAEEGNLLLRLDNFRTTSDEEKKVYYNSQED